MKNLINVSILLFSLWVTPLALGQPPKAGKLDLTIEKESFGLKDNVFIKVEGFTETLRLKVFSPELELVKTHELASKGSYFFQGMKKGNYLVEASDSSTDTFKVIVFLSSDADIPEELSEDAEAILKEIVKLSYKGSSEDRLAVAKIFRSKASEISKAKEKSVQNLIDETFLGLKVIVNKTDETKKQWSPLLSFLQKFYESKKIPSSDIDKYLVLWEDTSIAFERLEND